MIIKPNSITQEQKQEILELIKENAEAISINVFDKSDQIYDYLKTREIVKAEEYLSRLTSTGINRTHIIINTDDTDIIMGFILYHKVVNKPKDTAIICTIVSDKFRRKGIVRSMMEELQNNYDSITLSCFLEKVEIYSKFGFQIEGQWATQVGMYYGEIEDGEIVTIDDESLDKTETVTRALKNFQKMDPDWRNTINLFYMKNQDEANRVQRFLENF